MRVEGSVRLGGSEDSRVAARTERQTHRAVGVESSLGGIRVCQRIGAAVRTVVRVVVCVPVRRLTGTVRGRFVQERQDSLATDRKNRYEGDQAGGREPRGCPGLHYPGLG